MHMIGDSRSWELRWEGDGREFMRCTSLKLELSVCLSDELCVCKSCCQALAHGGVRCRADDRRGDDGDDDGLGFRIWWHVVLHLVCLKMVEFHCVS